MVIRGRCLSRCREKREIWRFPRNIAKFGVFREIMRNSPFAAKYRDIFCLIPAKYFKNNMLELNVSFLRDLFHFCEIGITWLSHVMSSRSSLDHVTRSRDPSVSFLRDLFHFCEKRIKVT